MFIFELSVILCARPTAMLVMKTQKLAATALMAITMAASAAPRLVVSTPSLVPESKIDLVLDLPVTPTTELGKTVENSWLEIKPALPGKLRWKAQNIAEFLPDQCPVIGATYAFSIPKNRKHLDNSAVPAGQFATLAAEEFRIVSSSVPNRWNSGYSPSTGEWILVFNDDIDPATAGSFISFVSKSGQRVAAHIERASAERTGELANNYKSWTARWGSTPATDALARNILVARPLTPLPPGENWRISTLKGLPNTSATARLTEETHYDIGSIEPFQIRKIASHVVADEPRRISITFNHPLPEELPTDFLTKFLSIVPSPGNLTAESDGQTIQLSGDLFAADQYSVTIRPGIVSRIGFPLKNGITEKVVFEHLDPLIALPSEDVGQLAKGTRQYRVLTQNLANAQIRIKKLSGQDLVRAFQGYRNVTGNGPDNESIRRTAPLPWSMVVGTSLANQEIPLGNPIDTTKIITLNWNEILPKDIQTGVLFLEASGQAHKDTQSSGRPLTQAIIQLTDIGLAWKLTSKEAFIYAFSCDTGAPLPGVKLQLFGEDATALEQAATDASGLATLPRLKTARHLVATRENDTYITAFDSTLETVGLWHFPVRYAWNTPAESSRQAFLFTDRSLYRPGETIRLKGILRALHGNAVEPSKSSTARIVIIDPTEKEILNQPVTISPNGSFDFTHKLAPVKTGAHSIRLEFPDELAAAEAIEDNWSKREQILESARFEIPLRVEEFRRNAFEITQRIPPPQIGATTVTAELSAKYYQGQPVAAGTVKHFSRITTQNPYPERFRDFLFGNHRSDDWGYWYHYFGYQDDEGDSTTHTSQLLGEAQLATDGSAIIPIEIPQADFPQPREVEIASEVTDANNQTLTARTTTTVHPTSAYVGISRIDRLARVGEALPLRIVAIDPSEKPFRHELKLTATLTRELNSATKTRNDSGETTTRNDLTEETIATEEIILNPMASEKDGQLYTITPKSNGLHFLTLRGTDPDGHPITTVTRFHVYGTDQYPWQYEDGLRVKLVAEKKSYQPGETARVLVLTPIEGTALVTIEREKVLRSFLVQLKADKPVIEIPLTEDDAPNAYVSVLIVKGAKDSARTFKAPQLRLGYCELLVDNLRDKLTVNLDTPAESSRPGDNATLSGTITLADGKPAGGAEITLYAEDEGTLAVMGYETPKPMEYFYQPRILGVDAGTSFESFITEDPEMQSFNTKGFFVGGGGDLSKLADLLRKNFDPCATWAPAIIADAAGKFSHTFKLPDTLTRYRVIAIAHHETKRFGHAESAIVVKKDLMLEPKAPRFAHQTDTINPQVLVQNASRYSGTWEIEFNAHTAAGTPVCRALGGTKETISLTPGASASLVFPTIAENTGEAVLSWKATPVSLKDGVLNEDLTRQLSDAVESRFQVAYPMPLLRQVKFVKLDQPGVLGDLRKALDPKLLGGTGTLDLEFARSPLAEAAGSIDFLLHYPYGCVEQTTSSLIPWCTVKPLKNVVPSFAKLTDEKVKSAIQAGADRLLSMQLPNGSFTYWPGGTDAVDWATPYAGIGLILASSAGASVPDATIDSLKQYLIESLRGLAETKSAAALETYARTLLVLSLAEAPQEAYQNAMIDRLADLTPTTRSVLAAAIAVGNHGQASRDKARQVMTSKIPTKIKDDSWMPYSPDRAFELIAWTSIDPAGPEAMKSLDRMLNERNPYGHWRSTWANGWSLVAMGAYAKENATTQSEIITLNLDTSEGADTIQLTPDAPTAIRTLALGPNLKLNCTADQKAFVRIRVASKPPVTPIQPAAHSGLSVDRLYYRINSDGSAEPLTEPKLGDLIRVSLRVTLPKDDTKYLVIEDPLPSVFETVNTDFKSQSSGLGISTSENDWNISHSELRSDRALFFLDQVSRKGTYNITYLARCTIAGSATAPPAKVESMYDPENFALSASRIFNAR